MESAEFQEEVGKITVDLGKINVTYDGLLRIMSALREEDNESKIEDQKEINDKLIDAIAKVSGHSVMQDKTIQDIVHENRQLWSVVEDISERLDEVEHSRMYDQYEDEYCYECFWDHPDNCPYCDRWE